MPKKLKIRRAKPKKTTPKKKPVLHSPKSPLRSYRVKNKKTGRVGIHGVSVQGSSRMKTANPSIARKIKRKVKQAVSKAQVNRLKRKKAKKKKKK